MLFYIIPFSHLPDTFVTFAALGGGEEDLLKQSSLGPTLTCQMTRSKLVAVSPAQSGFLHDDNASGNPV